MRLTNERATQRHRKVGSHEEAMRRLQRERRHDLATELASDCVEEGGDGGGAQGEEETVEEQVVELQIGRVDWVHRTVERDNIDEFEHVDAGEGGGERGGAGSGDHRLERPLHVAGEESR